MTLVPPPSSINSLINSKPPGSDQSCFLHLPMPVLDMEFADDHEFLRLSLSVTTTTTTTRSNSTCSPRKPKRKRREEILEWDLNESCEGKILGLLEMREQMLKNDENNNKKKKKKNGGVENGKGLHLIHSLLIAATSVDGNDVNSSVEHLCEIYQNISLLGDSLQRVAAYFSDGLVARILTRKSPFFDMIMKHPTPEEEFMSFTQFYKVSPFYQFAHFTANQSIIEAFEKNRIVHTNTISPPSLHVVDFDVSYGFQWPSLIQSLSEMATPTSRICLKITGFGRSLEELQETEARLMNFAKGFRNLVFEFHGLMRGSKIGNLRRKTNETLVVNLAFHLNTLNSHTKVSETLKSIHLLDPSLVVIVEQEGSRSPQNFLPRFMESLHYFAAMFDSLDDCLPADSLERLSIEKNHLGKEIKSVMNFDKDYSNNCTKYERMETWKGRMENHGFHRSKLSSKSMIQARLLLKIRSHSSPVPIDGGNGGFRIFEKDDGRAISLGWQDRSLVTVSAWHCAE